jgi:ADP-dependent NAD(P)H-hydrate dehydratase / NAD(P)H-hydrate epimerase
VSAYVLTAAQMRAVDLAARDRFGIPTLLLMENAGRGLAEVVVRRAPAGPDVRVVCGAGSNGGDGFVAARHLALAGAGVRVLLAAPPDKIAGDAAEMFRALGAVPAVAVEDLSAAAEPEWARALAGATVVVDALLGTGLRADVRGAAAAAIAAMNAAAAPKIAADIPSGLDADSGRARGGSVQAAVTVAMGARKLGLVLDPQAGAGDVEVAALGVPIAPPAELGPFCYWLEEADVGPLLPRRAPGAHKGTAGHLLVIAGAPGKTGAAALVGRAAMRAGAGLVTVASTAAGQAALDAKVIEVMTARYAAGDDADAGSFDAVTELVSRPHVRALAIGPGIPTGPGTRELVRRLVAELALPAVVDADGLNLLGDQAAALLAAAPAPRVVTPHPGEMARLAGIATADVERDRLQVARAFAARSRAVVVLKGARTLVVAPDGTAFVNPAAEPALGTAGSGDVLTGVLAALVVQGVEPFAAARAAVYLHGVAGADAARVWGQTGVVASDLPDAVAAARARLG